MNLIIDGNLTYPPSEVSCVRDITLHSTVWSQLDVLIQIERKYKDHVWNHLKQHGAFDYVEDIIPRSCREPGVVLSDMSRANIRVNYIRCENLNFILTKIMSISR